MAFILMAFVTMSLGIPLTRGIPSGFVCPTVGCQICYLINVIINHAVSKVPKFVYNFNISGECNGVKVIL